MSTISPIPSSDSGYQPAPPPPRGGISPLWLLVAVAVGFLLPLCACLLLSVGSFFSLGAAMNAFDPAADTGTGPGVGVVDLQGIILQGDDGFQAASDNFIRDLEWMEENDDVRAIVIRANSPGGDANASDVMWKALADVEKPVYVSMNGLCASGCYYVAMGADPNELYATPNTLVGSIGVISTFFNVDELLDNIGVDVEIVATGESKDFGSFFRDMTEEERAYWQEQIGVVLENFIDRVEGGRPQLNEDEVRALATGRIWSASIAQELGLIDGLMYPEEVLDHAADQAGLGSNYRVIEAPYEPSLLDLFISSNPGLGQGLELPNTQDLTNALQQSPIQYRYLGPSSSAGNP